MQKKQRKGSRTCLPLHFDRAGGSSPSQCRVGAQGWGVRLMLSHLKEAASPSTDLPEGAADCSLLPTLP
jgi:hypothetical protein